ncbi:MAG: transcriptional initiation protein Tat [Chthonomonadales bacterium]|nr:transcriptional initiation protein Tat [Chthonomonadales bacterium]
MSASYCTAPPTAGAGHYTGNREPLVAEPLMKLPIGSIRPAGWLRTQLELMRDGMVGHMEEISPWCRFEGSAWASATGEGEHGWEELPYWLKGYTDLGYVLGDREVVARAQRWLGAIMASQRPDGYFGPESNRKDPDLWPNMLALAALRSHYEATGDARVLWFMKRYFRWQAALPEGRFLHASWQHLRGADNLEVIYWLYNRTGDAWLLDLAARNHACTARWVDGIASWHGVNFAQGFREPGQFFQQSGQRSHLQAVENRYVEMRSLYGQVPGGMYGADENARPGFTGPRQAAETCAIVEMMYSHEEMVRITGDPVWADRCEEVALNSLPPCMTPDLKGLHYLTAPNQVVLDRQSKAPMIQNGGDMMSYTPYEQYRCCQHNVAFGWPYYAERLWMATRDNGLAAVLYSPCTVTARVGSGVDARVTEETDYPFDETVRLRVSLSTTDTFPIYLRVPAWCSSPRLAVNGKRVALGGSAAGARWIALRRRWSDGDVVELTLPMAVRVHRWRTNRNTASVSRGPLTFSLMVAEDWREYDNGRPWAAHEVWPASAWNFGLELTRGSASRSFEVKRKRMPADGEQPFRWDSAPVVLQGHGVRLPEWKLEANNLIGEVAPGPIASSRAAEAIDLIPMGCARLRVSAFPVIGRGKGAREWGPEVLPLAASWTNPSDTLAALTDGVLPRSSSDTSVPRFTWWDRRGTKEWVQQDFTAPRSVRACEVYWFDDEPVGGKCRLPAEWRVLWLDGDTWRHVVRRGRHDILKDAFSRTEFEPIRTRALRIEVDLRPDYSGGILEWRIE